MTRSDPHLHLASAARAAAADGQRFVDINLARLHQMGTVTHDGGRTPAAEDFRIIKRALLRSAAGAIGSGLKNGNLIVVSSALPGQGKTFCAINLAMSHLLDEIASRYADRIVLFDSPPLLLTTEAGVLASQMGQVVLVIESETTTQRADKEALRRLDDCAHINLICNKTRAFPGADYDGYYD